LIAEKHLTPEARAGIKALLGDRSIADVRLCTWADLIRGSAVYRRKYDKHDTWHYINIELKVKAAEFVPAEDNNHVLGAIERFRKKVIDPSLIEDDRKEALLFVVHFLGDMHQPLHCGNRDDDRGGNLQPVKSFLGKPEEKLNLHRVWDTNLVLAERGDLTNEDFAKRLIDEIRDEDRAAWQKGEVKNWIWESHAIVVDRIYKTSDGVDLPARDAAPIEFTDENYVKGNKPIVREQIKKGGIRLAMILNECWPAKKN